METLGVPRPRPQRNPAQRIITSGCLFILAVLLLALTLSRLCTRGSPGTFTNPKLSRSSHSHFLSNRVTSNRTRQNNGLTDAVEWDNYSLFIKGQRVFIWSGEFHPWRLPVPRLWTDVLEKMKAAGLNTVSIYVHWGLVNPAPGVFDFEGYRSLDTFFKAAYNVGLWVILRPGPYINAETTAGGIPHWVTSEIAGHLRTNDSSYRKAWTPYIREIARLSRQHQVTYGGPIIAVQVDNEYSQDPSVGFPGKAEMMRDIQTELRQNGIVVPLTYNDAALCGNYAKGRGSADIYGLDSYPQGFNCSNPTLWNHVVENYYDYHMSTNPKQPWFAAEFQGGAFDAWGSSAPGYGACRELTDEHFESVFFKNLYAANFKLINIYMIYGGTSWGHLPFPGVYTSYDYGAAISESRQIESPKYAEIKRQALFIRSTPDFYKTDVVGNSSTASGAVRLFGRDGRDVFATLLRNPDTGASFYIARHLDSTSNTTASFWMFIRTRSGRVRVPQTSTSLSIAGRESRIITSGISFGTSSYLVYSTAEIFWAGTLGDRDALILHGRQNQQYEAQIRINTRNFLSSPLLGVYITALENGYSLVTIQRGVVGLITLFDNPEQIVLYVDQTTATTLWMPSIEYSAAPSDEFLHYWRFESNSTLLVSGPHLVRRAVLQGIDNSTLSLSGDLKESVRLILIGYPKSVRRLLWNGVPVDAELTMRQKTISQSPFLERGIWLPSRVQSLATRSLDPPVLEEWKFSDSLPEISDGFEDDDWIIANHTSTNIPQKPYDHSAILYGCDYGFCEGIVLWRGHFDSNGSEKRLNLVLNGGAGFAGSVWLNNHFLATTYGISDNRNTISETNSSWALPPASLRPGRNVVTVVLVSNPPLFDVTLFIDLHKDNMGLEETGDDENSDFSKSPRGIRFASLEGGSFAFWRVQGKRGGYAAYPDRLRGIFNEGGSYGERRSWHLPDFDTSGWISRDISNGLPGHRAGLGFFATSFKLDIPRGLDVPMSFEFENHASHYRALLFINGWMMGNRVANLGPQFKFPVHEGILNYAGTNKVAVLIWATNDQAISPKLTIKVDGIYDIPT